ncbi:MAG: type IV pilus assembly protein PilM [Halanaerobiales bacterium]
MLFLKKRFTVIDIGTDSIKAATFTNKRKDLYLEGISHKSLPFESIKDGRIVDEAVVSNRLEEVVRELNCRNDRIITTIPNNNLIIRNMELPAMKDEAKFAEAVKWESEDHLPFPVDSAVEDYKVLSREGEKVQVLLVASKKDIIDNVLSIFERLSLTPSVINIQPMALISLVDYQNSIDNVVAIVDVGTAGTRVVIGDNKNIYLSRNIDIGGNEFTKIIMDENKMNYSEAENLKKKKGIQEEETDNEMEIAITQIATTGMGESQYLLSLAKNLAEQVGRSLDYYSMKYRKKVDKIYITGGGSKLKRLNYILESKIERELHTLDPYINIKYRKGNTLKSEEFAVTVGLAVGEVLEDES